MGEGNGGNENTAWPGRWRIEAENKTKPMGRYEGKRERSRLEG